MLGLFTYLEPWGTDTLPCDALAVSAVLTLAHLLAGHPVEARGAGLVAVQPRPAWLTLTLPGHGVAAEGRAWGR